MENNNQQQSHCLWLFSFLVTEMRLVLSEYVSVSVWWLHANPPPPNPTPIIFFMCFILVRHPLCQSCKHFNPLITFHLSWSIHVFSSANILFVCVWLLFVNLVCLILYKTIWLQAKIYSFLYIDQKSEILFVLENSQLLISDVIGSSMFHSAKQIFNVSAGLLAITKMKRSCKKAKIS